MNDYIADMINVSMTPLVQQVRTKKDELRILKNQLQRLNDRDAQQRKRREINNKKSEIDAILNNIIDRFSNQTHWSYTQNLFAAVLYYFKSNNDLKKDEYESLTEKWRNKVLEKGNDALLTNALASAGVKDFFDANFRTPTVEKNTLPPYSFFLQFQFTLSKPYISRDDKVLYPVENPVRKDKVFGLPMIEGSSWKGNMRWTARKGIELDAGLSEEQRNNKLKKLLNLFGNEKEVDDDFRQGRLHFYPTFFEKIRLEVINPHERKTKAGKVPVYIETVPADAKGIFSLLYFPFDLVGLHKDEVKPQFAEDFEMIPKAILQMMTLYGFSAKKSSGFGVTGTQLERGKLQSKILPDDYFFSNFDQMDAGFKQLLQGVKAHVGC